jgi:hypothetical protein
VKKNPLTHFIKHLLCIEGETNSNTPYQSPRRKKRGERGEGAAPGLLAADTFSPGWYLEPGLKVSNEPGLIETMNLAALKRPLALV